MELMTRLFTGRENRQQLDRKATTFLQLARELRIPRRVRDSLGPELQHRTRLLLSGMALMAQLVKVQVSLGRELLARTLLQPPTHINPV